MLVSPWIGLAAMRAFAAKPSEISRRYKGPLRSDAQILGKQPSSINDFVSAIHKWFTR
jgi:hypothetical protein